MEDTNFGFSLPIKLYLKW